jgi:GNAT superfamily N-acetyltransferase
MRWAEFLAVNLERDDWLVLIAVDGDLPVGYCMASVIEYPPVLTTPRYGFIQDMAVTAAYRRRGLATRLYLRAEQWLREKGSPRVELHVLLASETACAFWRRMGFREHVARMAKSFETGS